MRLGLWMGRLRRPLNCEALISKLKRTEREPIRTPVDLSRGVSVVTAEAIAYTRNGEDEAWVSRVWLDFPAQLTYVDMQVMRFGTITRAPYLGE